MTLTVETGAGIEGADSYVTVDEANEYHALLGNVTWDRLDDADQKEPALRKAAVYLDTLSFQGLPTWYSTTGARLLAWPRKGVVVDRVRFDSETIPHAVKVAQMELALLISQGLELLPTTQPERPVIKRKVGPIETTYSDKLAPSNRPDLSLIMRVLEPFAGNGDSLRTYRV